MITRRDSEFDDRETALLIAFREWRDGIGRNGHPLAETTASVADPNEYGPYRYVAHGPFTDWAEKARLDAEEKYRKAAGEDPNLHGMFWTVEKVINRK